METLHALLYGFIQGATEFLPVSSSGHLALLPHFLSIEDPGALFDLCLHGGTALAILIYFRRDLISISRARLANLALASAASAILILPLQSAALARGRAPGLIAFNLIAFGLFMWAADRWGKSRPGATMETFQWKRAILIGLFQALAIFPGVSRSGATLGMARLSGLPLPEAARFSFLLAVPIILGAMALKLPGLPSTFDWSAGLIGTSVALLSALAAIHFFLNIVTQVGLGPFCLYRLALGGIILALL